MQHVIIIGTTGSGKSTLAAQVAPRLDAAYIDLDVLNWEANWQSAPTEILRQRIAAAIRCERWVISGNYSKTRDLTWTRADTLIWLDYAFPLVLGRLFRRTIRRIVTQEDLWNTGNRESWRAQFFSRDSLFLWAIKTHWKYQRSITQAIQQPEYAHLQVIHFRTPRQTERWLKTL